MNHAEGQRSILFEPTLDRKQRKRRRRRWRRRRKRRRRKKRRSKRVGGEDVGAEELKELYKNPKNNKRNKEE